MDITAESRGGRLRIFLSGELDHHAARDAVRGIEEKLETELPRECVLDLSGLAFMDSSGVAVVLRTNKRMAELGGSLAVENAPPQARRVLDAAGVGRAAGIAIR